MNFITDHFQELQGQLYLLAPLVLGMAHGIEPSHSKTTMAAFIVATQTSVWRAGILGFSAALSHVLTLWVIAVMASHYGSHWSFGFLLPWFQLTSAFITIGMAFWLLIRAHNLLGNQNNVNSTEFTSRSSAERINSGASSTRQGKSLSSIVMFGAVSGIMPCPLTLGILLVCFQSGRLMLGMAVAASFSIGLALTMVTLGVLVAWTATRVSRLNHKLPTLRLAASYLSCALLLLLGGFMAAQAWGQFSQP